jgi:hypothetical protein
LAEVLPNPSAWDALGDVRQDATADGHPALHSGVVAEKLAALGLDALEQDDWQLVDQAAVLLEAEPYIRDADPFAARSFSAQAPVDAQMELPIVQHVPPHLGASCSRRELDLTEHS